MTRKRLPNRRPAKTFDFASKHLGGTRIYVTVGYQPIPFNWETGFNGERAEIFVRGPKIGSSMAHNLADWAVAVSLLLQYGGSLTELAKACQRAEDGSAASIYGEILDHLTASAAKRDAA
jgi:hypothetical protein